MRKGDGKWYQEKIKFIRSQVGDRYVKEKMKKPVIGYIAGVSAPKGRVMGHAGAIVSAYGESAIEKVEILKECGVTGLGGSYFGRPDNELTMRLSYVDFDGTKLFENKNHSTVNSEDSQRFETTFCTCAQQVNIFYQ